ncbi:MAG: S1 RNA-binding domain-containing protein [Acidobacteriota bacterium]
MAQYDDRQEDFGRILEDFERSEDALTGRRQERGRLVRQQEREEAPGRPTEYRNPYDPDSDLDPEDFGAALAAFEAEVPAGGREERPAPKPKDKVSGTILQLDLEMAFIDIGTKAEAVIPTIELTDEDGTFLYESGDRVEAEVVGRDPASGAHLLRLLGGRGAGIDPAHGISAGDIVEGRVSGINKGGAEVEIRSIRGFCPFSQLADRYVEDAESFVGRSLRFEVTRVETGRDGRPRNVVLSRRVLLEREKKAAAEAARERLEVGAVVRGRVTAIEPYGAFVDLGGLEGLVHVSELSHRRLGHPEELVTVGQSIEVRVEKLDRDDRDRIRVSLSAKALERDPWIDAMATWKEGTLAHGLVTRLQPFGAFVELQPGVEGLVPLGELGGGRRLSHPREVLKEGQELTVRVLGLDPQKRRISLTPAHDDEIASNEPSVREALDAHRPKGKGFGAMAHFFEQGKQRKRS